MRREISNDLRVGISLLLLLVGFIPSVCHAHPMGNFSINHYSKLTIHQGSIEILYLIDKAEIPTFQDVRQFDIVAKNDDPTASRYLNGQGKALQERLSLKSDGESVSLHTVSRRVTFTDGAGGLPTMKIGFTFSGTFHVTAGTHKISYSDDNFPGRAGWKEIVVLTDGVAIVDSSASRADRSQELSVYSSDVLNSPPQQTSALVHYRTTFLEPREAGIAGTAGGFSNRPIPRKTRSTPASVMRREQHRASDAVAAASNLKVAPASPHNGASSSGLPSAAAPEPIASRAQNTPRSRFTDLISSQNRLSLWVLLSAALIAAGLGALHALEPGHGKTVVAAYLVGSRGTAKHAVLLGIVVTAAHTAGVYLLGAATLYASRYIVPEQLYPWLGAISGLSVIGLGIFIFLRHWTGETGEHSHTPGEQHSHWFLSMFKQTVPPNQVTPIELASGRPAGPNAKASDRPLSLRELCMLGITGGIVPCPAALVVLLSAFSLHRIGFGLFLITAFSFGLAAVLVIIGVAMVYAKGIISSRLPSSNAALRLLPFLSSGFMVMLGVGITLSALASVQIGRGFAASNRLVPFVSVVLLGLFLGVRHSTDADHVVAVSTIVSRQKSIASSATIGLLWGLGHTLTIFLVGSAIIVFGVVIPPRLGLSMEFCVALMLILLGVLNLTGVIRWTTERFTPLNGIAAKRQQRQYARTLFDESSKRTGKISRSLAFLRDRSVGNLGVYQTIRPLVIGLIHGLAGSAAVALLVLSTIKSPLWSTLYLLIFGFGTMLGMMIMTAALSVPLVYSGKKFFRINQHLTLISGLASTAFGIFLVYQIGFVDGLFRSEVHWTPQ